jgi:L-alanine-DL-glutamate epimerase-like enolase superfamily enzyme
VETDLTLPLVSVAETRVLADEAVARGFRTLKLKVGGDPDEDVARTVAVAAAGRGVELRIDANQAWDAADAERVIRAILAEGVRPELVEQPTPAGDVAALAAVRRLGLIPVVADEAVHGMADLERLIAAEAADGINIKLAKCAPTAAMALARRARAHGMKLMIGCMLEGMIASGAAVHLACGMGCFDWVDLDSPMLLGLECGPGAPFGRAARGGGPALLSVEASKPGLPTEPV